MGFPLLIDGCVFSYRIRIYVSLVFPKIRSNKAHHFFLSTDIAQTRGFIKRRMCTIFAFLWALSYTPAAKSDHQSHYETFET